MIILNAPDLNEGFMMLAIGMGVVFSVLLLLFVSFNQLKRLPALFEKKEKNETQATSNSANNNKSELTADVNAAISMALYLYLNDQHDHESEVVTIRPMERRYSPWSSKIYGLNNILK